MLGFCTRTICSNSSAHQRRATGLLDGDLILLVVLGEIAQRPTRIFHHLDLVGVRGERRVQLGHARSRGRAADRHVREVEAIPWLGLG